MTRGSLLDDNYTQFGCFFFFFSFFFLSLSFPNYDIDRFSPPRVEGIMGFSGWKAEQQWLLLSSCPYLTEWGQVRVRVRVRSRFRSGTS